MKTYPTKIIELINRISSIEVKTKYKTKLPKFKMIGSNKEDNNQIDMMNEVLDMDADEKYCFRILYNNFYRNYYENVYFLIIDLQYVQYNK
jgi:hypothetical protein